MSPQSKKTLDAKFERRHWVYAFMNQMHDGHLWDSLLEPQSHGWNFFDYLVAVSNPSCSHRTPIPPQVFTPNEWLAASRLGSSTEVFVRLGKEFKKDPTFFDEWKASDYARLTGLDWSRFLAGVVSDGGNPSMLEERNCPVDWTKLGAEEWRSLLDGNIKWEPLFSEHYGWARLVDELCKAEKQDQLIDILKDRFEVYGNKFDWTNLPVPVSAQSNGPSNWSGWWVEFLYSHPEMSDRITPRYLGRAFWAYYSAFNHQLIKDLLEVRHPEWNPEVKMILAQGSSEVAER